MPQAPQVNASEQVAAVTRRALALSDAPAFLQLSPVIVPVLDVTRRPAESISTVKNETALDALNGADQTITVPAGEEWWLLAVETINTTDAGSNRSIKVLPVKDVPGGEIQVKLGSQQSPSEPTIWEATGNLPWVLMPGDRIIVRHTQGGAADNVRTTVAFYRRRIA